MIPENLSKSEKGPKQKVYLYVSLTLCTGVFIYFYSYPLTQNWNFISPEIADKARTVFATKQRHYYSTNDYEDIIETKIPSSTLDKLLPVIPSLHFESNFKKKFTTEVQEGNIKVGETKLRVTTTVSSIELLYSSQTPLKVSHNDLELNYSEDLTKKVEQPNSVKETDDITVSIPAVSSSPDVSSTVSHPKIAVVSDSSIDPFATQHDLDTETEEKKESSIKEEASSSPISTENSFVGEETPVQKGFLVFSEKCRIPDLDPMHPSIRHLVDYTPPLNCSEEYEPLTKTEGNLLLLDVTAVKRRVGDDNYSCCYQTVFRENDGYTDNNVGTSEKCVEFQEQTEIKDEFIKVTCKDHNQSEFYQEFHSFIHDKPIVEKRCMENKEQHYSVLVIGIDAVSRMNMHRQLNRTQHYLLNNMGAIEMFGFNKVGDNTFPNLVPLLLGYDERELSQVCWDSSSEEPLDKCNFLWKRFAEKGYRTFYAEDAPHISSFNYIKKGFYYQPTDYYFRPFILAYEDALGRTKPLNCHLCVGSVSETEAVLHWTERFASHFRNRSYFAFSWINSLTHDFLNMGSSGDHMYERFFRSLYESGSLNRTIVIVMGDHGMRWGEIRKTYIGRLEERLPMLLITLPEEFRREYPVEAHALKINSHRLITPYDLHATLVNLLHLQGKWMLVNPDKVNEELSMNFTLRAKSLFQPISQERSCDDAFIEEHWCTCEASLPMATDSGIIKRAAKFLVSHINTLLKAVKEKCAFLKLKSISDARFWQPPSEHVGHTVDDNIFTVVIHTKPGDAVFEGTIKISPPHHHCELLGTVSRLNLYGNQSFCVTDAILKKYCFCS